MNRIIDPVCLSCLQFLEGSSFLQKLNEGGDTVPGVQYKFIVSKFDEVVTPYTNGRLRDKNPLVQNVVLQDLCAVDLSGKDRHLLTLLYPVIPPSPPPFFFVPFCTTRQHVEVVLSC